MTQGKRPSLQRTKEIAAPVEKVFAFYSDPVNGPRVWPSLIEVRNVSYEGDRPVSYEWSYEMAGVRFDGTGRVTDYEPDRLAAYETHGGIVSRQRRTFEPRGDVTLVHEEVEYEVPVPLVGRLAERVLSRMNEKELEALHANLKLLMEEQEAPVRARAATQP
jgi:uncharacterized membrane protein